LQIGWNRNWGTLRHVPQLTASAWTVHDHDWHAEFLLQTFGQQPGTHVRAATSGEANDDLNGLAFLWEGAAPRLGSCRRRPQARGHEKGSGSEQTLLGGEFHGEPRWGCALQQK
jgi:hypothetical protein